jgi:hypothetical protein
VPGDSGEHRQRNIARDPYSRRLEHAVPAVFAKLIFVVLNFLSHQYGAADRFDFVTLIRRPVD